MGESVEGAAEGDANVDGAWVAGDEVKLADGDVKVGADDTPEGAASVDIGVGNCIRCPHAGAQAAATIAANSTRDMLAVFTTTPPAANEWFEAAAKRPIEKQAGFNISSSRRGQGRFQTYPPQ